MSTEAAAQTKATKPSGKDLKDAIKRQVEFYFSRANLANDAFLVSQMNSQMFVPVETIVGFSKIKQLTSNPALVVEAIQDSKVVVLNEAKDAIKPNVKSERNTIILREIPSDTKPEAVQALFAGCGDVSVRSDVGDTWFVTLPSEEAAVKTLLELRNKTFNDAPIKARLKSENVLKSFFPAPVEPVVAAGGAYSRGYYAAGAVATNGYYDVAANYGPQYAASSRGGSYSANGTGAPRQGGRGAAHQQQTRQNGGRGGAQQQGKDGRAKSNSFDQTQQQQPRPASRKAKDKKNKAAADKQGAAAAGGAKKGGNTDAKAADAKAPASTERQPVLNSANFPPLPAADKPAGSPYGEIKFAYAHEDILEIVKHMDDDDCKLPTGKMDFEAHAVALTPVAHPDLLRNQRTYSIEQAREALRQGRPIRSDSIGSIDYESMMYGEDYTKEARELRKQNAEAAAVDGKTPAAGGAAAAAAAAAPAAPKVVGYAAALIYGTPAPQPPVEAKKKASTAAPAAGAAAAAKGKAPKTTKGDEKKTPKKAAGKDQPSQPVVDETLPKTGAWGGRAFAEVVKSEPVNPPPAPAKAPAPAATTTSPTKSAERKNSDGTWERNQKDRRPMGGDKQ